MKRYKGVVVQRCYIHVEVEVEDDTSLDHVAHLMQEDANPAKGEHESEAFDIEEVV